MVTGDRSVWRIRRYVSGFTGDGCTCTDFYDCYLDPCDPECGVRGPRQPRRLYLHQRTTERDCDTPGQGVRLRIPGLRHGHFEFLPCHQGGTCTNCSNGTLW